MFKQQLNFKSYQQTCSPRLYDTKYTRTLQIIGIILQDVFIIYRSRRGLVGSVLAY